MHGTYHKINTIFKRDDKGRLLIGEWSRPEFEMLADIPWVWLEKIDGTNIRIGLYENSMEIRGKTDKAEIPKFLLAQLNEIFSKEQLEGVFEIEEGAEYGVTLYGEGYGNRIQKIGSKYLSDTTGFILFDVRVGHWWLKRESVEEIAAELNIPIVPIVGEGNLNELIDYVWKGNSSQIGNCEMEGVVAKPKLELLDRSGKRIITKLKTKDFININREVIDV